MKKNALYYHQELLELEKLINRIEDALEWVEGGHNRITPENDPECFFAPAFSFAEIGLRDSLEKFKQQHSEIVSKMSNVHLKELNGINITPLNSGPFFDTNER